MRLTSSHLLICFTVFLSACTSSSSEDMRSPAFGLDTSLLNETEQVSDMSMNGPDGSRAVGTATHHVEQGEIDGESVLFLTLVQELGMGTMRDSMIVDARTLSPIEYFNSFPGAQSIHTQYGGDGQVQSEIIRGDQVSRIDTVITGPYMDAASFTSFIGAFPLEDGFDTSIPVFHYEEGLQSNTVTVVGSEVLDLCGLSMETWVVDVTTNVNTTRFWVGKDSRKTLRVQVDLAEGRTFDQSLNCN